MGARGRKALKVVFVLLAVFAIAGLLVVWSAGDAPGASATGARLARMGRSQQWDKERGVFRNRLKRVDGSMWEMAGRFFFGGSDYREPKPPLKVAATDAKMLATPPASGLRVTWFGHSSFLVELDGVRTLVDPVWGERASPFSWAGPKRFYPPTIALEALPAVDAVIISHDHYDHLDVATVRQLANRKLVWLVPLGVGAHLEHWGIAARNIRELDWWDAHTIKGVTITATPSRHFSGRSVTFGDRNATLWAGWAWKGPKRSLFYSGDTALHFAFKEIGNRLGPFDLTLMEIGAYDQLWADVHLGPEQALLAHQMVKGRVMIPIHWGLFDLGLHGWTEPGERVLVAAQKLNVSLAINPPGHSFDIAQQPNAKRWWPATPWESVGQAPAWSSAVDDLQKPLRQR